jgi:Na+/proline symporter
VTRYDYAVLVFYFAFMLAISWVFRRFVANVSDYFRGGGKALWWMVGGSAFMVQFSAWTFTGAAGKAYTDGWPIIAIYLGNVLGFVVNALFFAPRVRQLRIVTGFEAVRQRFGAASEQFFTWLQIPFGLLQAGIWLYSLSVFFSAIFGVDLTLTMVVTGVVVVTIALLGGSWAVLASDFIQVLILMPVCLAVTVLAVLKIGSIGALVAQAPAGHLDFGQVFSKDFLAMWCLAMFLKQLHTTNNLADANRYLCVKDSRHARNAGFFGAALFLVGIVVWFVPPIAAAIRFPDLHAVFPSLKNPEEASFIAIARDVMPVGMMGLLVSGIFAATMSSMDSGLNKNTGFFIKNFYQPVLRPHATDAHLLKAGKITTAILGALVVGVAVEMSRLQGLSLFQWTQRVGILIQIPIVVPLFFSVLIKKTPPWAAWTTVLVGFASSLFITNHLTPEWAAGVFRLERPLDAASREYWRQSIEMCGNFVVCAGWFCGTMLFWSRTPPAYRARVEEFFVRLRTPVDFAREEGGHAANDPRQQRVVGWLCLAYGSFVVLLAAIPNPLAGRLAFAGCGAVVGTIGGLLVLAARRSAIGHGRSRT